MTYVWSESGGNGRRNESCCCSEHVADSEDGAGKLRRNVHGVDEEGAVDGTVQSCAEREEGDGERRLGAVHEAESDKEDARTKLS